MENSTLKAIKERRTIKKFESDSIPEEKIQNVLEAGRWAPPWTNKQPWKFIVIRNREIKEKISEFIPTVFSRGTKQAPVCIAVCVNLEVDPYHYREDGAAGAQNMVIAAQSVGLVSSWMGVLGGGEKSSESKNKRAFRSIRSLKSHLFSPRESKKCP